MSERLEPVDLYLSNGPSAEFDDQLHDECGVVGILMVEDSPIANRLANGLQTMQHRGQEAAGVSIGTPDSTVTIKDAGLVSEVLGGNTLSGMRDSRLGVGHVRYGTVRVAPRRKFEAAGPATAETDRYGAIALGHNGNFINGPEICGAVGLNFNDYPTDSAAVTASIAVARRTSGSLPEAAVKVLSTAEGAYSITLMGEEQLIGIRDPNGFRPLWLGSYPEGRGWALASEQPALIAMHAEPRRELANGEMIVCGTDGSLSSSFPFSQQPSSLCAFEYIYLSAPHGELMGRNVHMVRKRLGEILAKRHPVEADVVVGIPDSGTPGAEGFALASGIPKVTGIVKNRYLTAERSFITPGQGAREEAVRRKISIIRPEVYGRRLALTDDSIVRGTTTKTTVAMLREEGGAREVHLRITSAPVRWPCFYGMDTGDPRQLIANRIPDIEGVREYLNVDSLEYLTVAEIRAAASDAAGKLCMACMDGRYPTPTPKAEDYVS